MKITTKINILATAWLLCILMIINFVVFFLFMTTTVNMEENLIYQKAGGIIDELNQNSSPDDIEDTLKDNLISHSFIRIISPNNEILYEASNDAKLAKKIKGKYTSIEKSSRKLIMEDGEKQALIVRVPIKDGSGINGTLEIGELLLGLEMRKDILVWILALCTILAAFMSLLGGRWLSNIIIRPIANMIKTMEDIERSGIPQKISVENRTKDELQTMVMTFNRMIERLKENMEKQAQFVSDASHELKTPLTVIKSYANLLRRHGIKDQEITDEAIQAIHTEATRIQKMTETFLDLANMEKDYVLELAPVNLGLLCQGILKQLKDVYQREIVLYVKDQNPILITADELKLKQVIIILLDNAIKYSRDRIEVNLAKNEQHAIIRVRDYGIGIPQEEIENVFERFYRVDKARSRETGGSGLGLHIAQRIVKMHRGEIRITSEEGRGTDIEVLLPNN